jgi:large subunit ribosomal protein L18
MATMRRAVERIARRQRRKRGLRRRILGTPDRPRLSIYRSIKHTYAQIINDLEGRTLVAAASTEKDLNVADGGNVQGAAEVGRQLAARAKEAGITQVAFDRNGYRYHGRVKALADAAREAGLKF